MFPCTRHIVEHSLAGGTCLVPVWELRLGVGNMLVDLEGTRSWLLSHVANALGCHPFKGKPKRPNPMMTFVMDPVGRESPIKGGALGLICHFLKFSFNFSCSCVKLSSQLSQIFSSRVLHPSKLYPFNNIFLQRFRIIHLKFSLTGWIFMSYMMNTH